MYEKEYQLLRGVINQRLRAIMVRCLCQQLGEKGGKRTATNRDQEFYEENDK
ncbi:hypothetical protein NSA56_07860 [Oceanobacillus caeni]|uniref:hypothetical protein n=1 Tax=Bacillaceae TaxID=186817 RepID=UPI000AFC74C6|nr:MULTISPECIES: hypothetical protein [Bacillaceae]MCR1834313.1 hypothetical protein [Oceanobacillus caeni]